MTTHGQASDSNAAEWAKLRPRLAVLLSGGGRTLANLLAVIERGELDASIELVIASKDCPGVAIAREGGVPDVRIIRGEIPSEALGMMLASAKIDWVVLAGYLKYVHVPPAYRGRIVNIHPALLPAHGGAGMYGHHVHEAVIRAGDRRSGCTVHLVDEEFDHGQIILQEACEVRPDDTPETLAARVFQAECRAYPEALRRLLAH